MDTIKEKESEGTKTFDSITKSDCGERKRSNGAPYAKTMKWKKTSERSTIEQLDNPEVNEYNARPLRAPKT